MAIFDKQYKKLIALELLKSFLQGRLPSIEDISKRISVLLGKGGNTLYSYIPQPYKDRFNIKTYNKGLKQIKFDIDLLYEEIIDLINDSIKKSNYADMYFKLHSYELNKLQQALNNVLLITNNTDFYFEGDYDDFSTLNKTNIEESTQDIVDLSETVLSLPYGSKGTTKVPVSLENNSLISIITDSSNILSNKAIPGSRFENIFLDTISYWGYEVITHNPAPVELSFTFQIKPGEFEVLLNRIEIIPHNTKSQNIKILLSNDAVNFFSPLGYEGGINTSDKSKVFGLDFETTLVQYVRVNIRKESPDSEVSIVGEKKYQYIFGLKNIALYKTGRARNATYQSLPFTFTNNISKVALSSVSYVPQGTSVNYSIALLSSDNAYLTEFLPILPTNSVSEANSSFIDFNTLKYNSLNFTVQSAGDDRAIRYGNNVQAKSFYRIGPALAYKPVYPSASLYRGENCWYRDSSDGFKLKNVTDVYVSFGQSDLESFYDTKKEVITNIISSTRQLEISLSNSPYYNSEKGHLLKPDPNFQGSIDIKPNYAIYSVKQISDTNRITKIINLGNARVQDLPATNISLLPSVQAAILTEPSTGVQFQLGKDYELLYVVVGNIRKSTGKIRIPDGSALLNSAGQVRSGAILHIQYTPDADITHKVSSIVGDKVVLEDCVVQFGEHLEVEYRYIPLAPNEIVKASIRVYNKPTTANSITYYVEGTDYLTDPKTAAIQRIPNGRIPVNGEVFISFSYRNSEQGIHTFQTWCKISGNEPIQIKFDTTDNSGGNNLVVDKAAGEGFFINSQDGFFDISSSTRSPLIQPGWVQFIVRSKNPDANITYGTNLIDQVIQLRDQNRKRVFRQKGLYFSEITAFRDPMKQITLNHLKVNTLKSNHSFFAIDDTTDPISTYIVVNFIPGETDELYCRIPSDESESDTRPSTIPESFSITWKSELEQELQGKKLVVKIQLSRSAEIADGGVTPKVHQYSLKVGN